jgi:hypothetical protein
VGDGRGAGTASWGFWVVASNAGVAFSSGCSGLGRSTGVVFMSRFISTAGPYVLWIIESIGIDRKTRS